jgi:hypothetical protein
MLVSEIITYKSMGYLMARFMLTYLMPLHCSGATHNMEISKKEGKHE